jgi:antitoxin (DNA-binding transcriptional repressor) of toxin-antitoxin stability system
MTEQVTDEALLDRAERGQQIQIAVDAKALVRLGTLDAARQQRYSAEQAAEQLARYLFCTLESAYPAADFEVGGLTLTERRLLATLGQPADPYYVTGLLDGEPFAPAARERLREETERAWQCPRHSNGGGGFGS